MPSRSILVTGSSGLIGGEVVAHFAESGWTVYGVDNNMRAQFFGDEGDTRWNQRRLEEQYQAFEHHELDIRDRESVLELIKSLSPAAIVHAAAQPSHDLAAQVPFKDFDVNAVGTLNLLEAVRQFVKDAPFVLMSTNKVYGDAPNEIPLVEKATRWDYERDEDYHGVDETCRIDQSKHSLFGASKVAADILTQEYGRYFGMNTCCLRGGCLTGPSHSGVQLHGFLSYLVKCNVQEKKYTIFGYKGKQVRDNIHARDVARFIEQYVSAPRSGEVYNIGGGRSNSCSILEAFDLAAHHSATPMHYDYVDDNREGDHICYISDLSKIKSHYPDWDIRIPLDQIFREIVESWQARVAV